jgi:hypothetical protein
MQKMQPPQHYSGVVSGKTGSFAGFWGNNCVWLVCVSNPMVGWCYSRIGTSEFPLRDGGMVLFCECCFRVLCRMWFFRVYFVSERVVE